MLSLILILFLVGVSVAVLLWVGTMFLQGYAYSEPATNLYWGAPAAGLALTAFLACWCFLDYRAGDPESEDLPYDTLFRFSPKEFYPAKPFPSFISVKEGREIKYERRQSGQYGGVEYRDPQTNQPWSRESGGIVQAVIIPEGDRMVRYDVQLTDGKFTPGQPARYKEQGGRGRILTEDDIRQGQTSVFRWGLFLMNLALNFFHLVLWFVCLWLLLRFQWPHALGLALACWLLATFVFIPFLLTKTQLAMRARLTPPNSRVAMRELVAPLSSTTRCA